MESVDKNSFNFEAFNEKFHAKLVYDHYRDNDSIYIGVLYYEKEQQKYIPWDDFTTYLKDAPYDKDIIYYNVEDTYQFEEYLMKQDVIIMQLGIVQCDYERFVKAKINVKRLKEIANPLNEY